MERKKHHWQVRLANSAGTEVVWDVYSMWDPNWSGINEEIGRLAAVAAWYGSGKSPSTRTDFAPIAEPKLLKK